MGLEFFDIYYNFFIYSFFGWIYESLYVSFRKKTWVNRGFLNGPIIPIYGCGATLFYILFYNEYMINLTKSITLIHIAFLFMIGMICATILEFVTSWVMEKLFHAKWWDYSDYKYNIQGRISLLPSLFWGFLSVMMALFIQPQVSKLTDHIPKKAGNILAIILLILFLLDFTITVVVTLQLGQKLQAMDRLREELYEYTTGLKWYEVKEEIKGRFASTRAAEFIEELRASLEKVDVEAKIKEFTAKYRKETSGELQKLIYKRMFKAFPNMKSINHEGAFKDLKEKLKRNKIK